MLPLKKVFMALGSLFGIEADRSAVMIVVNTRLPRILLAMIVGAGISTAGCAFQAVFGNPLASPDTIGVSSGAAFGAAAAILLFSSAVVTQISAVCFGLLAIGITFMLSKRRGRNNILIIVLSGVIVGAFFSALVSYVKYTADPDSQLPEITFWLMGSMNGASFKKLLIGAPFIVVGIAGLMLIRWRLNILMLSEDEIASLGIRVKQTRWAVIILATIIVAASVSVCGEVGWVGLVVPHLSRAVAGTDNRKTLPVCALIGGTYLLVIDTLCRTVSPSEIPLSILTAILGAPLFAWLYFKRTGGSDFIA
ncbi:iron ABC transporter permease [Spirochaetia bacterium]|nr:iron ABC transporter permease [Spirochaetia bacterium]